MLNIFARAPFTGDGASGGHTPPGAAPIALRTPEELALEWQTVLALRAVIAQRPEAVADLLRGIPPESGQAALIYAAAREAVSAAPDRADVHFALAAAALRSGRRAEAEGALAQCLRLAPEHPRATALRARLAGLSDRGDA